eukprot:3617592-Prymnesium_polylepis.1
MRGRAPPKSRGRAPPVVRQPRRVARPHLLLDLILVADQDDAQLVAVLLGRGQQLLEHGAPLLGAARVERRGLVDAEHAAEGLVDRLRHLVAPLARELLASPLHK